MNILIDATPYGVVIGVLIGLTISIPLNILFLCLTIKAVGRVLIASCKKAISAKLAKLTPSEFDKALVTYLSR